MACIIFNEEKQFSLHLMIIWAVVTCPVCLVNWFNFLSSTCRRNPKLGDQVQLIFPIGGGFTAIVGEMSVWTCIERVGAALLLASDSRATASRITNPSWWKSGQSVCSLH